MSNATLEQRIQLIEDELALKKLMNTYQRRADEFNWAEWAETFTEDSLFEFEGGFGRMEGKQFIHDTCKAAMDPIYDDFQHYMVNLDFEIDGSDIATGTGNIIFVALTDSSKPTEIYMAGGRYRWKFARTTDGWRIKHTMLQWVWNNGQDADGVFQVAETQDAAA